MPGEEFDEPVVSTSPGGGKDESVKRCSDGPDTRESIKVMLSKEVETSEVYDSQSEVRVSDEASEGEELSLVLQSSPGCKRSPKRGMLRAVSSITITDIEVFEECVPTLRGSSTPGMALGKSSPNSTNDSPRASLRSPSYCEEVIQKPRRASGNSRRRRDQRRECWYSDDDDVDDIDVVTDEVRLLSRSPFSGQENGCTTMLKRRKSLDLLPNVPKRAPSTQELQNGAKANRDEDAEIERLMKTLHDELFLPASKSKSRSKSKPKSKSKSPQGDGSDRERRNSLDILPSAPRRQTVVETPVNRFDRFHSDLHPFADILVRHQSLEGIGFPTHEAIPRAHENTKQAFEADSDSEQEGSTFKVREFVVSLDYLEDQKARSTMPKRRRSFDALPTPPRRFLDQFTELDVDDNCDGDGDETSRRRRSFDDLADVRRCRLQVEDVHPENFVEYGDNLDQSHRSQTIRDNGVSLDVSHRSQVHCDYECNLDQSHRSQGHNLDQSHRSQGHNLDQSHRSQGHNLDQSHRSQGQNLDRSLRSHTNHPTDDEGRPVRRMSTDILPSLPRRHLASESSSDSDSDSELSPLPLSLDDALVQRNVADVLPNAPRRADSGVASRASSISFCDFYLEDGALSSSSVKTKSANSCNQSNPAPRLQPCDQLPALPRRDYSLRSLDVFNLSSEDLDQGNHADTEDNGVLEMDLESDCEGEDESLFVGDDPISLGGNTEIADRRNTSLLIPEVRLDDHSPTAGEIKNPEKEEDTETGSLDNDEQESSPGNHVEQRRKESGFLVRLFATRN